MNDKQGHDRLGGVAAACADDAEILALSIIRFVAAGYMTGDIACWDAAYNSAEELLGAADGAQFVASMVCVMRAIRAERQDDWRFMPAPCCRVTDDERQLLRLLSQGRQGSWNGVRDQAALLTGTDDAPRLGLAVRIAAQTLDRVRDRLTEASCARRCKAASLH
jgi:hypothetical protein